MVFNFTVANLNICNKWLLTTSHIFLGHKDEKARCSERQKDKTCTVAVHVGTAFIFRCLLPHCYACFVMDILLYNLPECQGTPWQHSSIIWSVWLNGWMLVYELIGCGFESRCCHLNFRYGTFRQTIKYRFTVKLVHDMIITYSQMQRVDKGVRKNAPGKKAPRKIVSLDFCCF